MSGLALPVLYITGQATLSNLLVTVILLVVGALLPDIYHPPVRRNAFLHSLVGSIVVSAAAALLVAAWVYTAEAGDPAAWFQYSFKIVYSSYILHLLGDSLTGGGIYFAWPFSGRRFRVSAHRYDDPALNAIFAGLGILSYIATIIIMVFLELQRVLYP